MTHVRDEPTDALLLEGGHMPMVSVQANLVQAEMGLQPAHRQYGQSVIQFTDGWVAVDVFQPRPKLSKGASPTARVVQIPFESLLSLDIEGQPDRTRGFSTAGALTFGIAGGLIGSGKRVRGVTRFVVATTTGWLLFETGVPAVALRATLAPVLERLVP